MTTHQFGKPARTIAERQRKLKADRNKAGLVRLEIWTRPEHKEAIRKYAQQLNKPA